MKQKTSELEQRLSSQSKEQTRKDDKPLDKTGTVFVSENVLSPLRFSLYSLLLSCLLLPFRLINWKSECFLCVTCTCIRWESNLEMWFNQLQMVTAAPSVKSLVPLSPLQPLRRPPLKMPPSRGWGEDADVPTRPGWTFGASRRLPRLRRHHRHPFKGPLPPRLRVCRPAVRGGGHALTDCQSGTSETRAREATWRTMPRHIKGGDTAVIESTRRGSTSLRRTNWMKESTFMSQTAESQRVCSLSTLGGACWFAATSSIHRVNQLVCKINLEFFFLSNFKRQLFWRTFYFSSSQPHAIDQRTHAHTQHTVTWTKLDK